MAKLGNRPWGLALGASSKGSQQGRGNEGEGQGLSDPRAGEG